MSFLAAVVVFAAVFAACLLVTQLYRWPRRPAWLDRESVVMLVSVAFTGSIAGAVCFVVGAAFRLPLPVWGDAATAFGGIVGVFILVRLAWATFGWHAGGQVS